MTAVTGSSRAFARPDVVPVNPTQMSQPAFLLNAPFSYSTEIANNIWMEEIAEAARVPDHHKAMAQFMSLYNHFAAEAFVAVLPTPRVTGLQDLVFTANLGLVLDHLPDRNTVLISNFTSDPRKAETQVGVDFFRSMGYEAIVPPTRFEGEAEIKHLHDNVYVGGHGLRSDPETYDWMASNFDMTVVKLRMTDPYLYHLDCSVFPVTRDRTLVCTALYERAELAELERYTEIIDVSVADCYAGICNSVRLNNTVLISSHLHHLRAGTEEYERERSKDQRIEEIASSLALDVHHVDLAEYEKGGASLSCLVMHLNRVSYES
ncbi:dimethylarginine dimethylaminohydrolase family protein [Lentzea sp. NPDC058436]|uniref:dimethylarginine dimethylaminohydrolase family protein n=1 Tax=Lentzea sp. NPDC058436 TaxID=3346499 RepID=UPI00365172B0